MTGLPRNGVPREELMSRLRANRHDDADWRAGRIFGLIYNPDDPELEDGLAEVAREYLVENALNPRRFPSLARLERETADAVADLLHGAAGAGGLTSGGTESIFLAVYVAREVARERGITSPSIVTGVTAHPAFAKACHALGIRQLKAPVGVDKRIELEAFRSIVDDDTILVVASAPCYPYGVIDRVAEIAGFALQRNLLCHVDACLGGLLLPFWERLGEPVPPWDFRVPGVTSISADVHKYGYAFKGASTLLWRNEALYRRQWWIDDGTWGAGLYGSVTTVGTRPAPPIAGAWAALHLLGEDGYLRKAEQVRRARNRLLAGLSSIADLRPTVAPDLSVLEISSDAVDLSAVADALEERGWFLNRQPGGLHLMLSPVHDRVMDELLEALAAAVAEVESGRAAAGVSPRYA